MKKHYWLIITIISFKLYSQEILNKADVYTENNLVYKVESSKLFTGRIQNFKHKNHLLSELEFDDGILVKAKVYFNGKEKIVSEERYYFKNGRKVEKKIKYSLDYKTIWTEYFDEYGNKILEEDFKDGIIIYRCPYSNNKKNGKVFSINQKGEKNECLFENGILIKTDKEKPNG
jgi:antitoxin component YwqK of YwqJK toxin-antitoxin module